jgi:tetratricopeptide (TPR) repeat protein
MMWSKTEKGLAISLFCLLAGAGIFWTEKRIERMRAAEELAASTLFVPPARVLKVVSLGFDNLFSDFYWLRAIQYYGEKANARENYRWLYPLMDLVTDMDPGFAYAYKFSGVTIPYDAASAQKANLILEKGLVNAPQLWQIPFYIGYNYLAFIGDYRKAGEYISRAANIPGAPPFLSGLASRLYAEAGRPELALDILGQIYNSVEDDLLRQTIEERIKLVVVERDLNMLNKAVTLFLQKTGRYPEHLGQLVQAGIISSLPREPHGGRYYFDPAKREVVSSKVKERLKLYRGKK